ncbi:hypothetical protein [Streptomyces sp. Inha503]
MDELMRRRVYGADREGALNRSRDTSTGNRWPGRWTGYYWT